MLRCGPVLPHRKVACWLSFTQKPTLKSSLSPHRAFVVQFRAETDVGQGRCTGRVEHVVSGQATHFASLEELLAFIARVLTEVRTQPRRKSGGGGS